MTYTTFNILTKEELDRLYTLPVHLLEQEKQTAIQRLHRNKGMYPRVIDVNRPFYILNKHIFGVIKHRSGNPVLVTSETRDFTNPHAPKMVEYIPDIPSNRLDIYYLDEAQWYEEVYKVIFNRTTPLLTTNPNCRHELELQMETGVRCIHCKGVVRR